MPKLLIISNEALNRSGSNGRTMLNFLGCFKPDELAQFHLHGDTDFSVCKNYYRVSDRDALNAVLHLRRPQKSGRLNPDEKTGASGSGGEKDASAKIGKNCRNFVLRDMVWRTCRWWNRAFDEFLADFSPDAVLLQAGDGPFMYAIARKIAERLQKPLLMYNSEGFVLKDVLYSSASKKSFWHHILQKRLKTEYGKFMTRADYCFYITEYLEQCYQQAYPHPGKSMAIYTASDMQALEDKSGSPFHVVYCGNLGVGRVKPLGEVADALAVVDPEATLDIYGRFRKDDEQEELCAHRNVRYFGTVPYEEIPRIMSEANLLLHCEATDRLENLRYAFSTKIADSLASGRPFLVYADRKYPFMQYLHDQDAAHLAGNMPELNDILKKLVNDRKFLSCKALSAVKLASDNHKADNNSKKFYQTVCVTCDRKTVTEI